MPNWKGPFFNRSQFKCRQLEKAAPELKDAVQRMEDSTRKLRAFHFKGILAAMFMSCLVIMGGCFAMVGGSSRVTTTSWWTPLWSECCRSTKGMKKLSPN